MGSLQFAPTNKHSNSFRESHQFSDISHETVKQERSENIGFFIFRSWSKVEQLRYLIRKVWSLTTTNLRYSISLWGYAISNLAADLMNVYFVLWLSKFVISGELTSQDQAKEIFEEIILFSGITLVVSLPVIGWAADRLSPINIIIASFLLRGILIACIWFN